MSVQQARAHFSDLIGHVHFTHEAVLVEKRGKVFAVVVSPEQYAAHQQGREVSGMKELGMVTRSESEPRPLTESERQQALEAIEHARAFREKVLSRRGGKLFSDSAALIREEREVRSSRL